MYVYVTYILKNLEEIEMKRFYLFEQVLHGRNTFHLSMTYMVYKGGNRDNMSDYRPISVLPVIAKILEKLINSRLTNYLNKFKILSTGQYGFRQGRSTEDAVEALSSLIVNNIDSHKKCLTIFLDLKKAFDTVSVQTLVQTMERMGIRGVPLQLLKSYLSERKQKVKIGDYISGLRDITYGVPQGSVLGPTLFLIYINSLCNMQLEGGSIFTYADDTAVVFSGDTWEEVRKHAETGLIKIAHWLKSNLLTLNISKTNYICFTNNITTQPDNSFKIKIHTCHDPLQHNCLCTAIDKVNCTKYLGILVDQRLTWHAHTELVMSRVRKMTWIFKNLRHVAPKKLLNQIYTSLAQSVLVYCIPIWGGATKTNFIQLERAQRALLKVMYFKPRRFPTSDLYVLCDLLSVRKLYALNAVLRRHKSTKYVPIDQLKRRKRIYVISIPTVKTAFARRQYATLSGKLYNLINKEIDIYPTTAHKCRTRVTAWLKTKTYGDLENIILNTYKHL